MRYLVLSAIPPTKPSALVADILDFDAYYKEIAEFRDRYAGQFTIRWGVEIGLQPQIADVNRDATARYPFDFVIGSSHVVHGIDPYYPKYYEGRTEAEAYLEYFESILENLHTDVDFDVYGHIDYVVRYGPNQNRDYSYKKYSDVIDEIPAPDLLFLGCVPAPSGCISPTDAPISARIAVPYFLRFSCTVKHIFRSIKYNTMSVGSCQLLSLFVTIVVGDDVHEDYLCGQIPSDRAEDRLLPQAAGADAGAVGRETGAESGVHRPCGGAQCQQGGVAGHAVRRGRCLGCAALQVPAIRPVTRSTAHSIPQSPRCVSKFYQIPRAAPLRIWHFP